MRRIVISMVLMLAGCGAPGQNIGPATPSYDWFEQPDAPAVEDVSDAFQEPDPGPAFGGILGWKALNVSKPGVSWTDLSGAQLENGAYEVFATGQLGEVVYYDSRPDRWKDISLSSGIALSGVWGLSDQFLFVVGEKGALRRRSDDTGSGIPVWHSEEFTTGVNTDLTAVHGTSKSNVWVVGKKGVVLRWDGTSWNKFDLAAMGLDPTSPPDLNGVLVLSDTDAIVAGNGVLMRYMLVNAEMKLVHFDDPRLATANMSALAVDQQGSLWVGADKGRALRVDLSAGGIREVSSPSSYSNYRSLFVSDSNRLYAGGDNQPLVLWFLQDASVAPGSEEWTSMSVDSPESIGTKYPDRVIQQARITGVWGTSDTNLFVATREKQILQYAIHP